MPSKNENTAPGPQTLQEALIFFADENNCLSYLVEQRWPDGVMCPTCGSREVHFLANQRRWKCRIKHERQQFSVKMGTVMEDSPISLTKWLPAMWMIANCKNGISSYELHRALGITQKSAWFMLHRVRLAMQDDSPEKLSGKIEADETFIGGSARFMHKDRKEKTLRGGRGTSGKAIVMGILERGDKKEKSKKQEKISKVQAMVVNNTDRETLQTQVRNRVETGSDIYTDEHAGYEGLNDEYTHQVIAHAEAYVRDHVYTNGIENFWTLLKRAIKGSYVAVEPFHLHRYVDEEAFRFNERKDTDNQRLTSVIRNTWGKRLTYKKLTGDVDPEPSIA